MAAVDLHEAVHQAHAQLAMIENAHLVEQAQQDALQIASAFQRELESSILTHEIAADHAELEKKFDDDLRTVMQKVEEVQNTERDQFKQEQERIQQELRLASQRDQSMQTESSPRVDTGTNAKLQVDAAVCVNLQQHVDVAIQYEDSCVEQSARAAERVESVAADDLEAHHLEDTSQRYDEETFEESEAQHLPTAKSVEHAHDRSSLGVSSGANVEDSFLSQGELHDNEVEEVEDESIDEDGYGTKSDGNDSVSSSVHSNQSHADRIHDYVQTGDSGTLIHSRTNWADEASAEYGEDFENSFQVDNAQGPNTYQDADDIEDVDIEVSHVDEIPDDTTTNDQAPGTTSLKQDSINAEIMDPQRAKIAFAGDIMGDKISLHSDLAATTVPNAPNNVIESFAAQLKTRKDSEEALLSIRLATLESRMRQDLAVLANEIKALGDVNRDNSRYQELMLRQEALRMAFASEKANIESQKAAAAARYYQDLLAFQTISTVPVLSTVPAVSFPHVASSPLTTLPTPHLTLSPKHMLATVAASPIKDPSTSPDVSEDYGDDGFASGTEKEDIVADDVASDDVHSEGVNGENDVQEISARSAPLEESEIAESDGGYGDDFGSISEARSTHSSDDDNTVESNDTGSVKDDIVDSKQENLETLDVEVDTEDDDQHEVDKLEDRTEEYADDDFASVSDTVVIQQSSSAHVEDHDDDIPSVEDDAIASAAEPSVASEVESTPAHDYEEDEFEEQGASTSGIEMATSLVSHSDDSSTTKLLVAEVENLRQSRPADTAESEKAQSKLKKKKETALELIRAKEAIISQQSLLIRCEEERKQVDEIAQLALNVNVASEVTRVKETIKQELRSEIDQLKAAYPGLVPSGGAKNMHTEPTKAISATDCMKKSAPEQPSPATAKVDEGDDYEVDSFEHEDAKASSIASVEHRGEASDHSESGVPADTEEIEEDAPPSVATSNSDDIVEDEVSADETGRVIEEASADYEDDAFEDVQSTHSSIVQDSDRYATPSVEEKARIGKEDADKRQEVLNEEDEIDEYLDDDDFEGESKSSATSKTEDSPAIGTLPSSDAADDNSADDNSATSIISQHKLDAALAETITALDQPPKRQADEYVTPTEETQVLRPLEESVQVLATSDDDPISRSIEEQTIRLAELRTMIEQRKLDIVRVQRQLRVEKKKEHLRAEENALWAEMEVLERRLVSDERILELSIQRNRLESVQLEARHEIYLRPPIIEVDLLAEFDVVEAAEPPVPPAQTKESEVQVQLAPPSAVAEVATNEEGDLLLAYDYVEDVETTSPQTTERPITSGAAVADVSEDATVDHGDEVEIPRTTLHVMMADSAPDPLDVSGDLNLPFDAHESDEEDLLSGFDVVESVEPVQELSIVANDDLLDGYDHIECAETLSPSVRDLVERDNGEPDRDSVDLGVDEDLVACSGSDDNQESRELDIDGDFDRVGVMETFSDAPVDALGDQGVPSSLPPNSLGDSQESQSVETEVATAEGAQSRANEVNNDDASCIEDSSPELLPGTLERLADGLFDDLMREVNDGTFHPS
ncbi:hypothetical protein PINS_up002578 [Pythium insidiosum]|nr:hypothetical protein PINS_up002578 [Pythium insidiosum]